MRHVLQMMVDLLMNQNQVNLQNLQIVLVHHRLLLLVLQLPQEIMVDLVKQRMAIMLAEDLEKLAGALEMLTEDLEKLVVALETLVVEDPERLVAQQGQKKVHQNNNDEKPYKLQYTYRAFFNCLLRVKYWLWEIIVQN